QIVSSMRKKDNIPGLACLLVITMLLGGNSLTAQTNYTIKGMVADSVSNEPMAGPSVYDSIHRKGIFTGNDGRFTLTRLQGGPATLTITYLGYNTTVKQLSLPLNQELMVRLLNRATNLAGVTVVGSFEGQQIPLNQQKAADNIKNIFSADLIGKFPDLN